jgi:hypothetical protein
MLSITSLRFEFFPCTRMTGVSAVGRYGRPEWLAKAVPTEGHKDHMSQRKTQNASQLRAAHPPPLFNFEILFEYFKYFYFNVYISFLLVKVFYY